MDLSPAAVDCLTSIIISLQISLFKGYRIVIDALSLPSKQAIYLPFTSTSGIIKGRNPQHSRRTLWRISVADPRTSHSAKGRYLSEKQVVQYHWFVLTFVALMPLITRYFLPAIGAEVNACTIWEHVNTIHPSIWRQPRHWDQQSFHRSNDHPIPRGCRFQPRNNMMSHGTAD